MNARIPAVAILALACLQVIGCQPSEAPPKMAPHRILFQSNRLGNTEVFVMNTDGTGVKNLSNHDSLDYHPMGSPDGSTIAFITQRDGTREIYTMTAEGSDPRRLTQGPTMDIDPGWNGAGTRLTFDSDRDGDVDVYSMAPDGSDVKQVTNHDSTDSHPWFSPDGSRIAFYTNRDGNYEIYSVASDGSDVKRLTDHADTDQFPSYSPDGARIVFSSYRGGDGDLFTMNADGSDQRRLLVHEGEDLAPAWSPDGNWITFVSRAPASKGSDMDVFLVAAMAFGSDAVYYEEGRTRGEQTLGFLDSYVAAGLPNAHILRMATMNAGDLLGANSGRIAAGVNADIIAMAANPLDNIHALRDVAFVMKDGHVYKRDGLFRWDVPTKLNNPRRKQPRGNMLLQNRD